MPHRITDSAIKPSAVRKTEPILLRLLTLSRTITNGLFSASLNSSILFRSNSETFNFRIFSLFDY